MAQQTINTNPVVFLRGSIDPMIPEFRKINENFTELYAAQGAALPIPAPPSSGAVVLTSTDGVLSWEEAP